MKQKIRLSTKSGMAQMKTTANRRLPKSKAKCPLVMAILSLNRQRLEIVDQATKEGSNNVEQLMKFRRTMRPLRKAKTTQILVNLVCRKELNWDLDVRLQKTS
jgi:hypothetical protein